MTKIRVVCATRKSEAEFFTSTATGRSLAGLRFPRAHVRLFASNTRGLPSVYNQAIAEAAEDPAILVFAHDDLHVLDFFWVSKLVQGLAKFDVIGLAGNTRRVPRQPAWAFVDDKFTWDARVHLSGVVGHGHGFPPENLSVFGQPGREVKLLDGLLLAADSRTLQAREARFDERFAFHLYDMDFCRTCEARGLRMGTWALSVVHESGGAFGTPSWREGYAQYLAKWGD
jgi:GT2 family glycosyltransferase